MHVILWISVVLAIGCYICEPVQDPDLWWHITIGRWIQAHGQVPLEEHWNRFALGEPFKAYSWLVELLFASVDDTFGDQGLIVLKLVFGVLLSAASF
ncbi:MAG: hypothetical protein KDD62_15130, partial [Bdellovibrionales bacterium]|nr:hypothetical protein [Bdellovibrionales bacterium]